MFGFFIGTACLLGLVAVARGGRRHFGHGGGCHGRRGFGGRFVFRRILERLDTTPGQEKVIREAIHDLKEEAWALRREVRGTRVELAQALRAPELDKALIDRVFAKHDEVIEKLSLPPGLCRKGAHHAGRAATRAARRHAGVRPLGLRRLLNGARHA